MEDIEIKRRILFSRCETKEHLRRWIKIFLDLDYDFQIICDDDTRTPPSNSSPLDLLWEIYQSAMDGYDPEKTSYLAYASRDGYKTLTAAVLEILCLFHFKRDVGHLAAVEGQALNCANYVKAFLDKPILRDFRTGENKRTLEITRYERTNSYGEGEPISPAEWEALPASEQGAWEQKKNIVRILVATMAGTNSFHCSFLVFDELDLAPAKPIEEAKMVAAPGKERGELPIVFMTSTRKFNFGLVQKAIDEAEKTGLIIKHWNLIDMSRACPPSRHLPDKKKLPIYYSEKTLKSYSEEQYKSLPIEDKKDLFVEEGYEGCVKNCKIFAMCRGRLATKQKSKSRLLKSVDHVQKLFLNVEAETAKAQLLSWKPSTEGLIYGRFDKRIHMLSAAEIARRITSEDWPEDLTKAQLISIMKDRNMRFFMGQDYGYSHAFGGVTMAVQGAFGYVIDGFDVPGLEVNEKIEYCNRRFENIGLPKGDISVFGDTESPSDIKSFKKAGYSMKDWSKLPGSVLEGIECVRIKLNPIVGLPQIYFLKGDEGCELLAKRVSLYHWKVDTEGGLTDIPDDTDDDILDAFRYVVMNVFPIKKGKITVSTEGKPPPPTNGQYDPRHWMAQAIAENLGQSPEAIDTSIARASGLVGKKGSIVWDAG